MLMAVWIEYGFDSAQTKQMCICSALAIAGHGIVVRQGDKFKR
jgi:hypothetical protein